MGTVDTGRSLIQYDLVFIRSVDIFRAQNCLPAGWNSTCGSKDVVIAFALIEFWAFDRGLMLAAIKHHPAFVKDPGAVRTHLIQMKHTLDSSSTVGPRVNQIGISIIVPKGTRIDPTPGALD